MTDLRAATTTPETFRKIPTEQLAFHNFLHLGNFCLSIDSTTIPRKTLYPNNVRLHTSTIQVQSPSLRRSSMVYKISRDSQKMPCECGCNVSMDLHTCYKPLTFSAENTDSTKTAVCYPFTHLLCEPVLTSTRRL